MTQTFGQDWKMMTTSCQQYKKDKGEWTHKSGHSKQSEGYFNHQNTPGQLMTWSMTKRVNGSRETSQRRRKTGTKKQMEKRRMTKWVTCRL